LSPEKKREAIDQINAAITEIARRSLEKFAQGRNAFREGPAPESGDIRRRLHSEDAFRKTENKTYTGRTTMGKLQQQARDVRKRVPFRPGQNPPVIYRELPAHLQRFNNNYLPTGR